MPEFDCQCCGHCCEGRGGIIVSTKDLARLCAFTGLSAAAFTAQYAEKANGKLRLRNKDNGTCVFFEKDKGCTVHEGKPDICRAWPYFRGNLVDSESLEMAKQFCPGIPADIPFTKFQKQGIAYLQKHNLIQEQSEETAAALHVADLLTR